MVWRFFQLVIALHQTFALGITGFLETRVEKGRFHRVGQLLLGQRSFVQIVIGTGLKEFTNPLHSLLVHEHQNRYVTHGRKSAQSIDYLRSGAFAQTIVGDHTVHRLGRTKRQCIFQRAGSRKLKLRTQQGTDHLQLRGVTIDNQHRQLLVVEVIHSKPIRANDALSLGNLRYTDELLPGDPRSFRIKTVV